MDSDSVVSTKLEQLRSASAEVRASAAQFFATLGEQPAAAVPLVAALDDADEQVREWVVAALESLGPPQMGDVAALIARLTADHALQAYWAATLLGRLGPNGAAAQDALSNVAVAHADPSVKKRAAWALDRIAAV